MRRRAASSHTQQWTPRRNQNQDTLADQLIGFQENNDKLQKFFSTIGLCISPTAVEIEDGERNLPSATGTVNKPTAAEMRAQIEIAKEEELALLHQQLRRHVPHLHRGQRGRGVLQGAAAAHGGGPGLLGGFSVLRVSDAPRLAGLL